MRKENNRRKVGIITYHAADNYGSVLQAYALSHYLSEDFSVDCNIINYRSESQRQMYAIYFANDSLKNILKNIYIFFVIKNRKARKISQFSEFRKKYLKMYPADPTSDVKKLDLKRYDLVICGSDQIWNVRVNDYEPIYMLKGIDIPRKMSYAASMGGIDLELTNDELCEIQESLKKFSGVSVREDIAKKMLLRCTLDNLRTDIDPTFLLSAKRWKKIMAPRRINGEYIFFYSVDYNEESVKIAEWYGNKLNLPVVYVNTSWQSYFIKESRLRCIDTSGVEDFLSLIYYAKAVLSGSFHGTAFSLIFNKPFYRIKKNHNQSAVVDDRIISLFNTLEIRDREISTENYKEMVDGLFCIDYPAINKNIQAAQNRASDYFMNMLSEEVNDENRAN